MKKLYQKLGTVFLTIVMAVGLLNILPVCRVQAAKYPSIMIKGVPYYPQKLSGDCGISSIAMIEACALGYDSSCYDAVYDGVMLANEKSVYINAAVNNGKYRDISKDLGTIYSELAVGRPVLVYRTKTNGTPHWSVIVGYNGSTDTLQKSGFIVYNTMHGKKPGEIETDNLENWLNGYTWSHAKVRDRGAISGITTSVSTLTLEITYPENIQVGNGVASTGLIISMGNITEVSVSVKTTGGSECFRAPTERPNSKYYTLLTQDPHMKFGSLSVGSYLYCVSAKDSTGATLNWEQQFTVSHSGTSFKKVVSQGTQGTQVSPILGSSIFSSVRAENVTVNSAKIIADYANDSYGDVGFYFGTSPELAAMTKVSEYKYSNITTTTSSNNSYQVGVYYDDTYQYKWWTPLTSGTTYYYAFYCTKNGAEHISGIQSFTTVGGGESAFPLIDGEIYKIYSVLSGHVMEVSNGDNANGKRITLWPYGDVPWMQWKAVRHPDGYSFLNMSTGKALDISGGSAAERAALQQWDYCAADAQRFRLVDHGNGRYGMFARCSGLAVDVYGSFTDPGAQMEQYAFHGGDNQLWSFELIDKTAPVISNVRVTDVDSSGYTVLCDVTDNAGVARVTFPTWTEANGQDDLAQNWYDSCAVFQPAYGNTYTFRINSVDHNNEYGLYYTYIYAYDAAGNSASEGCSATLQSPAPTAAPTAAPTSAPTAVPAYCVSGTIKLSGNTTATVELIDAQGLVAAKQAVSGSTTEYHLGNVPAGTYTLRVNQANGVEREYSLAVTDRDVSQDTEVQLLGDVNGDGTINARDQKLLYNHLEKIALLSGYRFQVGDVNGDGTINARDKKLLYNHIERIALLW